jgi:hypothetical protein
MMWCASARLLYREFFLYGAVTMKESGDVMMGAEVRDRPKLEPAAEGEDDEEVFAARRAVGPPAEGISPPP